MRSRRSAAYSCALAILFGLMTSLPAFSQKSEAEIQDDIEFAKGLATEWGFVDLAGDVIKAIEREGVSRKTKERLGVAKCEIYAQAAIAERDRLARNALFEQAVQAYESFLEENPNSEAAAEAESRYINTCSSFARSLELAMEEVVGEEAEALRLRRVEVLTAAVARTGRLIEELMAIREPTEAQKRERGNVMLVRGRMLLELGRSQEDGEFSFQQAHQVLEEVVFDQGEGSPNALRAYDLIGQVYGAQQDWEQAAIYFEAVIEQALPSDPEMWKEMITELELGPGDKEQRWLFVELSTGSLCDALMATGDVPRACKYALHMINTQRLEGFSFSTTIGYPSLLSAAKTLLDAGGVIGGDLTRGEGVWYESEQDATEANVNRRSRKSTTEVSLDLAKQVVAENQGNVLQVLGQKLIAEITTRPGAVVDPSILYEAAEGKYNAQEYGEALPAFRLVLAAIADKDRATQILFAPKTYYRMGRSYQKLDRHLEACVAFREGCTTWLGDPEYDAYNAKGLYDSAQVVQRNAPGDAIIKALYDQAERIAAEHSSDNQDEINFKIGEKARRIEKDYDKAIDAYQKVGRAGISYEKAIVNIGVCKFRQEKKDEALEIFADYLENFVTNELNSTGGSAAKEGKRRDAMATAGFYRALIEYERGQYEKVIAHTREYYKTFPEQDSMAPWTMRLVGNSLCRTGKIAEAKQYLQIALGRYPDDKQVAAFALEFYKELSDQYDKATGETRTKLLREMAELLAIGNASGSAPSYPNLRNESKHWYDLGEWERARVVLEKVITAFGDDPELSAEMDTYIKPDMAHVLLELHRVPEAHAFLTELVSGEKKPSKQTLIDYTRSVIGWVEGTAVDISVVLGAGTTEAEFTDVADKLNAMSNAVDKKWACEWYDLKFRQAYGYYVWATAEGGPKDSRKLEVAKRQLDVLVQELGSEFQGSTSVPGVGQVCDQDPELAAELGSDTLRRRLVWLWKLIR